MAPKRTLSLHSLVPEPKRRRIQRLETLMDGHDVHSPTKKGHLIQSKITRRRRSSSSTVFGPDAVSAASSGVVSRDERSADALVPPVSTGQPSPDVLMALPSGHLQLHRGSTSPDQTVFADAYLRQLNEEAARAAAAAAHPPTSPLSNASSDQENAPPSSRRRSSSSPHVLTITPELLDMLPELTARRRARGRTPGSMKKMIPIPSGAFIDLDVAVNALVDAALPLAESDRNAQMVAHALQLNSETKWHSPEYKRVKNLDSAKRSRMRREIRQDLLRTSLETMQRDCLRLQDRVHSLMNENRQLRMRLASHEDDLSV